MLTNPVNLELFIAKLKSVVYNLNIITLLQQILQYKIGVYSSFKVVSVKYVI